MTQEDKNTLLKDLCARLPYGVKVHLVYDEDTEDIREMGLGSLHDIIFDNAEGKPYLRPMSSMTDKEETLFRCELPAIAKTDAQLVAMRMELFLKGHLDFNHLIEKGLALKAPDDMYKTE